MCAMSVNEITKLAVSVLAFQWIFHFVHWYWCYELISNNTSSADCLETCRSTGRRLTVYSWTSVRYTRTSLQMTTVEGQVVPL